MSYRAIPTEASTEPTFLQPLIEAVDDGWFKCDICGEVIEDQRFIHPSGAQTCELHRFADKRILNRIYDSNRLGDYEETVSLSTIPEDIIKKYDLKFGSIAPFSRIRLI